MHQEIDVYFRNFRNSSTNNLQMNANCQYRNSLAEKTLRKHSPSLSHRDDRPLVVGKDGKIYPQYISCYSDRFDG